MTRGKRTFLNYRLPSLFILASALAVSLAGCLTTEEALYINSNFDRVPTRSEIEARNAEIACKNMARNLVQMARCDVRR